MTKNINFKQQKKISYALCDLPFAIKWFTKISSTNAVAKQFLQKKSLSLPYVLISDSQTAGYGKNGRHFVSQKGGIYLSLVVPMSNLDTNNIGLLTTGIAWQLRQAISHQFKISTDVKWVNDLLLNGKKVSGILIENQPKQAVVIGIGCNLFQHNLTEFLPNSANLLTALPSENQICEFLVYLIRQLYFWLLHFPRTDFLQEYKEHLTILDKEVTVQLGRQVIMGRVIDLNSAANLILETTQGIKIINSGEVIKIRPYHR